ncbi:LysR family transcriptional regulator [Novosphingobium terrae]|uniref:LysR family transcriptional regulator n=1 Tax=Novosphingobium terrae TaxID=2726189 RepID=UPI0019820E7F|nr:LysR family transcriptional regulator [Novosphingobium terrae]
MMADPHLLASFLAIYRHATVTAAAESLGLQQPTVSLHLRALRDLFDDPLFVRQAGRMLPTPRADALAGPASDVLDRLSQLTAPLPIFDAQASKRTFRLAMTDASQVTLLPAVLDHFTDHAPGLSVVVRLIDDALPAALIGGEVDLALGHIPWLEDCRQQALYTQNWVCLRRRSDARLDRAAYEAADHVTVASGTGAHLLDESLKNAGITRRIRLVVPGFLGLAPIIGSRTYLATIPRHSGMTLAALDPRTQVCELPFEAQSFRVSQYWHERYERDPGLIWLRKTMLTLFSKAANADTLQRDQSSP